MLFERVKLLSEKRGKNVKTVALELGLSENYFYSWKTSNPKSDVLEKVADYFDVSVDYLLGREKGVTNNIDEEPVSYFRIDTTNLSDDEISQLEEEMAEYQEFIRKRIQMKRERKRLD